MSETTTPAAADDAAARQNTASEQGEPQPAAATTTPATKEKKESWVESVIIALLLALAIRHFLVQAYKIPSGSMIPTLLIGDQLIASKISYGIRLPFAANKLAKFETPKRGDIVVFRFPEDPDKDFIKRTIGLPGERVRIRDGVIYINDEIVVRREHHSDVRYETPAGPVTSALYVENSGNCSYNVQYDRGGYHAFWDMDEVQLADDEIFVMGDNRDHSNDSRFWGPVKLDLLEGKPLLIHFSWDSDQTSVRFNRMGRGLRCE